MTEQPYDLVLRGGTIIDGTGADPRPGDVAVKAGRIVAVGTVDGSGAEEIDAAGCIVTPGFVDIHTHYDGQVTWEHRLSPSSQHGVTTVVMGNCGVGFAPIRAHQRDMAIRLMEGVEDIPEPVMADGLPWAWESFTEYLDFIGSREADIDFAAQLPHNPLRVYVMGERGAYLEVPTEDDLATMRAMTTEAIRAGAIGVSTTLSWAHRFRNGDHVPTHEAQDREVMALAEGLRDAGTGVFQIIDNALRPSDERLARLRRIATTSGRPVSFTLAQTVGNPADLGEMLHGLDEAAADGLAIRAQVMPRPIGTLMGLDLSLHPFASCPSFAPLADLPLARKVAAMREPGLRERLLAEEPQEPHAFFRQIVSDLEMLFLLGDPPNYHPDPATSIAARARAEGRDPKAVIYDALLAREGKEILYRPSANRSGDRFEGAGAAMIASDHAIIGLGDGGAHYGMICDAAYTTYFLQHWAGHPDPARRVPLAKAIRKLTRDPAEAVGLADRGTIAVGQKADLNVIAIDRLALRPPSAVYDLPAGGRRLVQSAEGYEATVVSGVVTYRGGEPTGALPGRLVRGARAAA
ncbi:amidohydrolase family protein [Novosphingobium bradum]|uniref:Amidohydrolase family protein n=1 Tax=Novosphingobium bradum TaxID=1737444 RepID=A0ABV7IPK6_9SPHN